MVILREAEATGYLERLNSTILKLDGDPPFPPLRIALQIELSYFQKLMRDSAKKDLAVLVVSSNGFPELPSLMVDIGKAYEELKSIEESIGGSVISLLSDLEVCKDLAAFDVGVERVVSNFNEDQQYVDLLKKLRKNFQSLNIGRLELPKVRGYKDNSSAIDKGHCIFTEESKPGLLFYETAGQFGKYSWTEENGRKVSDYGWRYRGGFLKYVDSLKASPVMINNNRSIFRNDERRVFFVGNPLQIIPEQPEVLEVLNLLDIDFRGEFLSVDFTTLPDGSFYQFIKSSAKMGPLLQHVKGVQELALTPAPTEVSKPEKKWWRLGR